MRAEREFPLQPPAQEQEHHRQVHRVTPRRARTLVSSSPPPSSVKYTLGGNMSTRWSKYALCCGSSPRNAAIALCRRRRRPRERERPHMFFCRKQNDCMCRTGPQQMGEILGQLLALLAEGFAPPPPPRRRAAASSSFRPGCAVRAISSRCYYTMRGKTNNARAERPLFFCMSLSVVRASPPAP